MQQHLEDFINGDVFREKMEKMTRRTVEEVLRQQKDKLEETINKTVDTTLLKLGVHIGDAEEIRKDFVHVRNSRKGCELVKKNSLIAFITVVVPTISYFVFHSITENLVKLIK